MKPRTISIAGKNVELLKDLGKGTYGSVYLINVGGSLKAIKIISNKKKEGIKSLRELDVMGKLSHPNIMRAEGILVGIDNIVTLGVIMPLANTDLQRILKDKNFTITQRLKILFDILNGIKYLHDSRYLHLDLKPMNILIFGEGNNRIGKITDFGISLILDNENEAYYPGELVTITHRAPEIISGNRKYTKASDVWSLGIIFLEVLSRGKPIYSDFTKAKVRSTNKKLFSPGTIDLTLSNYLAELPTNVREAASSIIKKMLSFKPRDRPTLDEIMNSDLFTYLPIKDIGHGIALYKQPFSPKKCDIIYYYGFDYMVRLALKFPVIKTETFFLAADIYQRSLAYAHNLTGNFYKDWPNVALTATTSLYMAIKMLEPFNPKPDKLAAMSSNIFKGDDIILVEAALTQLFEGIIYPKNLFTESECGNLLLYAFELLHNCHIYYRINLDLWKKDCQVKPKQPYNKFEPFSVFFPNTTYAKETRGKKQKIYLPEIYKKDLTIQ